MRLRFLFLVCLISASQPSLSEESGTATPVSKAGIVYVTGDVHTPTRVAMEGIGRLTVLEALELADGANPTANLHNAKILRKGVNGSTEIPVDIRKIMRAKAPDVTLHAGDILFIPHNASKSAGKLQNEYFYDVPLPGPLQGPNPIYNR
jgi:protein involved in polysaccharide export with SLBB domain